MKDALSREKAWVENKCLQLQVGINRKRKVEANCGSPPELRLHEFLQKRLRGGAAAGGKPVASSAVEALQKHQSVAKVCLKNDTGVTLPALSDVVTAPSIAPAAVKDASSFARAIPKRPEVRKKTISPKSLISS